MTTKEKSPAATPCGDMAKLAGPALPPSGASTARTIASRQVSVRDSAQEFHIPAAQFSVSKYQLMPQTGTVAAMMAATGSPRLQTAAERRGQRVARCRIRMAIVSRHRSQPPDCVVDPAASQRRRDRDAIATSAAQSSGSARAITDTPD